MTGRASRLAATVVGTVWALMLLVALAAIALNGRNIPFAEDWGLVAPLTGHEPDLRKWLWAQNSEHRLPVPRFVGLALLTLTHDYRTGMVLNAAVLAAIALAMMLAARRVRGGVTSYADAFFPLVFLHLGHWDNIVWSWQMQFVLATAFTCVLLLVVVTHEREVGSGASVAAGVALMALPLSGATGLVFVPAMALWMALTGYRQWRASTGATRWSGMVLFGSAILAMALVALYFVGWQRPPWTPASPGLKGTLSFAARFTAFGLGPAAGISWRISELLAFVLLIASGLVAAAAIVRRERQNRLRTVAVILFLAAGAVLALAIGSGRAGRGRMSPRYALLGVPVFCMAYFIWEMYGPPAVRRTARTVFLLVALGALPLNTRAGMQRQEWFARGFRALEQDLAAEVPSATLAERHHAFLQQEQAALVTKIQMLERAQFGPFAGRYEPGDGDPNQ